MKNFLQTDNFHKRPSTSPAFKGFDPAIFKVFHMGRRAHRLGSWEHFQTFL